MSESKRPYSKLSDGRTLDPLFGPVWIKETKGLLSTETPIKDKYCPKLYTWLEVDMFGKAWMCCPSWLPYPIGNVLEETIEEIWNGEKAQTLRQQIFNNDWKYCQKDICPVIVAEQLVDISDVNEHNTSLTAEEVKAVQARSTIAPMPTRINFSNDESCNLKCPSCRTDKLLFTEGPLYERRKLVNDRICNMLFKEPSNRQFSIHVTGSGDPFASRIYRDMLTSIDGKLFPNLTVCMQTNGVMFTPKMWNKLNKIHANLGFCQISFDAGTKNTYENITRLGGDWDLLLENCRFLDMQSSLFDKFNVGYDFVVQKENYKEMKAFIELVLENFPNARKAQFALIVDWGTWPKEVYEDKCIWKETHPEHQEFLECLKDPIFSNPKVDLGNMKTLWKKANGLG
jgi:sulfatase maturation enzyme AslB (radical SAM superfamily)